MPLPRLRLPKLRVDMALVDPATGKPTVAFTRWLNDALHNIETTLNSQSAEIELIEQALTTAGIALTTAQAVTAANSLANSYTAPGAILSSSVSVADATKATVVIADHVRHYGNGSSVNVTGTTIDLLDQGTVYYVYYDDSARAGGVVTYHALTGDTAYLDAGQTGTPPHADRHACGRLTTAASGGSGPTYGGGPRPAGTGTYQGLEDLP